MPFTVRSIEVGRSQIPGPELFWMSNWDDWFTLSFQVLLIRGEGITALVNSGPPDDLTRLNALWEDGLGPRARLERTDDQRIVPALARHDVRPQDVTHLLLTPLQLYTTGNVQRFPDAEICITRRGWVHFHTTHEHPHDVRWNSMSPEVLVHLVTDAWDRVRLLADEDELAPGLRTWWCGVHHRASMVVEIDTARGTVAASDAFFHYENVEDGRLLGINENMYEALATNERVLENADHLVPLYDPKVFERYPDGVVSG